jgi:hypothetical protein
MRFYNQLISDDDRSSHSISLDYDVVRNSEEYREILSFWHTRDDDKYAWMIFSDQLNEWKCFGDHQRYVRKSDRFSVYCQRLHDRLKKHEFERSFQLNENSNQQNKLKTWIEFLNWEYWSYDRNVSVISRQQSRHDEVWKKLVNSKILKSFETETVVRFRLTCFTVTLTLTTTLYNSNSKYDDSDSENNNIIYLLCDVSQS